MRKMIVSTMMTLDGVEDNPQNWSFDYWNDEIGKYVSDQLFATDVLVMGRITYEAFAEAWSSRAGADAFADRINALPKYVASRTAKEPLTWNSNLIKGDVVDFIRKLKEQPGQDILQYGCGELTYTMIEAGLVDELRFLVYPVTVGEGARIFEQVAKTPMKLLSSQAFSTGVIAHHYEPQGSR